MISENVHMSEEDASIRKNIWPVHYLHYLLIQNLIYLTSMSMNIFLCKEAANIELSQQGIPSDFHKREYQVTLQEGIPSDFHKREYQVTLLMIFLLAICLNMLIQQ